MVEQITVTGMVISAMPVGEYDKRLVLVTKEKGKITVFAKGARRQNNRFVAATQPFSFGRFHVYPGKEAYNLVNVDITEYFDDISKDLECMYYGFYLLELSGIFTYENIEGRDVLRLLYGSLKALTKSIETRESEKDNIPFSLIRRIFELKLLAINGEYPDVFKCYKCGSSENLITMDMMKPGALCSKCIHDNMYVRYNTSTFYTMQYIISAPIEKLYSFKVSEEVLSEFADIMDKMMRIYVNKEIKSLEVLEMI
ncbi:MAG: DNA repair protein RecO [Lachnospiraceae bacterium]|nr:DNA repair protein RecO [Lachnospiraceae bacterium]